MSTFDPLFNSRFDSDTTPMEIMDASVVEEEYAEEVDPSQIHLEDYEDDSYTTVILRGDVGTLRRALP